MALFVLSPFHPSIYCLGWILLLFFGMEVWLRDIALSQPIDVCKHLSFVLLLIGMEDISYGAITELDGKTGIALA